MNTKMMTRIVVGALTAGAIGAGGLGAGTAHADLAAWCPGQPLPNPTVNWEMHLCHTYELDPFGNVIPSSAYLPPGGTPAPPPPPSDYCQRNPVGCHFFGPYGPGY